MALPPIQAQWDIGSSIFSASGKALELMRAATVDDVQPVAVYAVEALGTHVIVDPHLIGKAVDALGGSKSYRLHRIKLQFGISSGGISNQLRQSTAATKTFLLISVLKLHLPATDIADVLYEMLAQSEGLDTPPVSSTQLCTLVQSIEGHSLNLLSNEFAASKIIGPIVENLALHNLNCPEYYMPLLPNEASQILLAVFTALRDSTVRQLKVTGQRSAIWFISIFCWLCPNDVAVLNAYGEVIVGTYVAKICLILRQSEGVDPWTLEHWYTADQLSSSIQVNFSDEYMRDALPDMVSNEMVYSISRLSVQASLSKEDLQIVRTLASGFVLAGLDHISLSGDRLRSREDEPFGRLRLRAICRPLFETELDLLFTAFGWPPSTNDRSQAAGISSYLGNKRFTPLIKPMERLTWLEVIQDLDRVELNGALDMNNRGDRKNGRIVNLALHIAQLLLGQATQQNYIGYRQCPLLRDALDDEDNLHIINPWPLSQLLSSSSSVVRAEEYFANALRSLEALDDYTKHWQTPTFPLLAFSFRGQVAFYKGLFEIPKTPAEAFEIVVLPGSLKWKGNRHTYLQEAPCSYLPARNRNIETYTIYGEVSLTPQCPSLKINNHHSFQISVRSDNAGIYLHCTQPSTGDNYTAVSVALVTFALAARAKPSNRPLEDQLQDCIASNLRQFQLKKPGSSQDVDYGPADVRVIASYSGDPMADFMRFGTGDASALYCIIQGNASIYDCAVQANQLFGSSWLIMSNP